MSTTIDQKVVEMRFDNKHFENNISDTMSTLEKFKQKLNLSGASKGLENINTAASKVNFSGMSNAIDSVVIKFSHLQATAQHVLNGIVDRAIYTGKRMISALTIDPIKTGLQEYETQINAVQTILANTESKGTTLQDVNRALDELNTYADKTIYNFTEMTRNIGTFTAAGIDLDTSVSAIQGIANLAAVSGSTSQQASTAMYQLSQALASGTVKLMDWNSVVNAGMGGQVFQDALKQTARIHGINIDAMIKREGSFRETLKDGWITSEILTETLEQFTMAAEEGTAEWDAFMKKLKDKGYSEEQAKAILKMGNTATEAATKVKTFSQLWATLKESAQSGWTQSWETIIGDFGEAKEFLTDISDRIGKMIGDSANARNSMLTEGLSSGWKQLLGEGIADEEGYKESIKELAKTHGTAFEEIIKKTEEAGGTFDDALVEGLKKGVINSNTLSQAVHNMSDKMSKMSAKELQAAGYTAEHVKEIQELSKGLKDGSISMDEFVKKMNRPSGRENLIQALWNSFDGLMSVITPVKEAFRDIFPALTGDQLYSFTERLANFTEKLKLSEEASKNLKDTFKGIFSIFDMGRKLIITVLDPIAKFLTGSSITNLGGSLLALTGSIGNFFTRLNEGVKIGEGFGVVTDIVVGALELISDAISMALTGFNGLKNGLSTVWDGISVVVDKIMSVLGTAINWIRENISIGDIFAGLAGGGLFLALKKIAGMFDKVSGFFDNIKNIFSFGKGALGGFKELLGNLNESLSAFTQGIKTASLVGIAIAITLLTSALRSISDLEVGEIAVSLITIRLMIAALNSGFAGLCKTLIKYPAKKTFTAALSLMAIAKAVDILADAMTTISKLSWEELIKGLIGMKVCISALTKSMKHISQGNVTLRTSIAILALAKACQMLGDALKKFGSMSWEEIAKGLVAMGGALTEFTLALKAMNKFSGGGALSGSVAMLIASKSLDEISENLKKLGSMGWEEIGKGLTAMGGALTEFGVVLAAMGKFAGFSNILAAVGLLIASKSLDEISENLDKLGSMSWEEIARGLSAMGGALVELGFVLTEMGRVAGFKSIFAGGAILIVTEGMDEITEALQKIGLMTWENIARGLSGLGGVLVELGLVLTEMGRVAGFSNIFASGAILIVTQGLDEISETLNKLGLMSWEEIGRGLTAMGGALLELSVVCGLLGKLAGFSGIIGGGSILVVVNGLDPIAESLIKFGSMSWEEIGRGLTAMGGALVELGVAVGALGYLTGFAGLVGAGTITLASQGLGEIADALIKFGSMSWDEIGRGLAAMSGALGAVGIGGLLNTFSALGSVSIATIAKPLGDLADSFKKWGDIRYEDISGGLEALNVAFAEIAAGSLLNTLSLLGSASIAVIAEPLGTLADSVMKWTDVIVPEGLAGQLAALAAAVLEFTFGGFGANAIATAAPGIGQMADSIAKWSGVSIPDKIDEGLTNIANGVKAFSFAFAGGWSMSAIVDPLSKLPDSVSKWNGVSIPDKIDEGLTNIATGVKAFSFAFTGGWSIGAIVGPLAGLADTIVKWKGVVVPDSVKDGLTAIAEGIKQFTIIGAIKLTEIAQPINTLSDSFMNFSAIDDNGGYLVKFANNVVSASTKLDEVNTASIDKATTVMNKLSSTMNKVNGTDISNVGSFVDAANKLNDIHIEKIEVDTGALQASIAGIKTTMITIKTTIIDSKSSLNEAMKTAVSGLPNSIDNIKNKIDTSIKNILNSVITTIDTYKSKVETSFRTVVSSGATAINGQYNSFVTAGGYLGDGLISGINSKKESVYWAAYALGQAAVQGEKDGQQSNSPSKATIKAGNWFGEGLIIGIQQMNKKVNNAGYSMGEGAISSISNTLNNVSDIINSDIDAQPTIRPVLDLTDVESGVGYLGSMFNSNPSIGLMSNIRAISSGMNNRNQNGTNNDVVSAIDKLRKDLGNNSGNTYNVNGITYDDGSKIATAVEEIIRAVIVEGRV